MIEWLPILTSCLTATSPLEASDSTSRFHLVLQLPAYRLELWEGDSLRRRYRVAIGESQYPTPSGRFTVTAAEWNPEWIPPNSPWARGRVRTPPGPTNPMGRVKLLFRPEYFIHGTPESTSVERPASHGCVRLRNADAIELAATLLRDHLSAAVIDSLIRDTTTRRSFPIAPPVPLEVIYRLLEVDRDSVRVYRNVYHLTISPALLHTQAMAQLGEAGIDTVAVDRRQLDRVIRQGVARGAVVPIDGVLQKR